MKMPFAVLREVSNSWMVDFNSAVAPLLSGWVNASVCRVGNYIVLKKDGAFPVQHGQRTRVAITRLMGEVHPSYFDGSRYKVKRVLDGRIAVCLDEKLPTNKKQNEQKG